jgi:predicted phosphodiesterase
VRYLILSDIHGNLDALQAVLREARGSYASVVNCGDLVGYGPEPNQVVDCCREHFIVRGNHDKACATLDNLEWFNAAARDSAVWTHHALTAENRTFLAALPKGPAALDNFEVLHGAPDDEDEYVMTEDDARLAVTALSHGLAFFGHTHLQGGFAVHRNGVRRTEARVYLDESMHYLLNPGSVGQPRDNDPRAAYAVYDTVERSIELRRVAYDIAVTHRKIVAAGLPEMLGLRLFMGV